MPAKEYVKQLIKDELKRNRTAPGWGGTGVVVVRTQFSLTEDLRSQVQTQGDTHGCHTCLADLSTDRDQPWVGDHIPPTNLKSERKGIVGHPFKTYLFPQCHECAREQAALVKQCNKMLVAEFRTFWNNTATSHEKKLFKGGTAPRPSKSIDASGPKVTSDEGDAIQALGKKTGCHSCGAKVPCLTYHADHTFPQEFCTSYMESVFALLGISYPITFELKPQCPRCSGNQGGKVRQIRDVAIEYARENGITVYKFD